MVTKVQSLPADSKIARYREAVNALHDIYQQTDSQEEFIATVVTMDRTISAKEASFIFRLMSERPAGPSDSF